MLWFIKLYCKEYIKPQLGLGAQKHKQQSIRIFCVMSTYILSYIHLSCTIFSW